MKQGKNKKMDPREAQMNKAIMREIKEKKAKMKELEKEMEKKSSKKKAGESEADSINERAWKNISSLIRNITCAIVTDANAKVYLFSKFHD